MKELMLRLRHWWQRNFGHVYLSREVPFRGLECFRIKSWFGRINLVWFAGDFVCKLAAIGDIINVQNRNMRGYGKPFGDWKWSYEPTTDNPKIGGAW